MKIFRHSELHKAGQLQAAYAIGNFDGVHLGHQQVLATLRQKAAALHVPSAVLSFFPHPRRYFNPEAPPGAILPFREKVRQLENCGIDMICVLRFDKALATLSATDFVRQVLCESLRARHIVTGENFIFGAQRQGDNHLLTKLSATEGFGYTAVPAALCDGGIARSSSRIRALLKEGEVEKAAHLLGHLYALSGRVRHGAGRGRHLGYPTLNLALPAGLLLPKFGVYVARAWLDGTAHPAIVNLGVRPTFGENTPVLEAHLLDANPSVYDWHTRIELLHHLRPEQKFVDAAALQTQIAQDIHAARQYLENAA